MIFKRILNKRVFRLYLERKKDLGYYVTESLAYANRSKGFVNHNFCQNKFKEMN